MEGNMGGNTITQKLIYMNVKNIEIVLWALG